MKIIYTFTLLLCSIYAQAQFNPNNLIVSKISSSTALSTAAGTSREFSLVEYTRTGTVVSTKKLATTGPDQFVIEDRRIAHEGQLSLSANKQYLTAVGYANTAGIAATPLRLSPKVVLRMDKNGVIDLSTKIPAASGFEGASVRAAVSRNGSEYFVNSGAPGVAQGTRIIAHGASTTTLFSPLQYRSIGIFGNKVIGITQDNPALMQADTLPVALPNITGDLTQFVFFDTNPTASWLNTGYDLLYIGHRNSGILKYYFDGTGWKFVSSYNTPAVAPNTGFVALTGEIEAGLPTLYGIKIIDASNESFLVKVQDKVANNVDWNATGNLPNVASLASASSTELFKGVSFAPTNAITATQEITAKELEIFPTLANDEIQINLPNTKDVQLNFFDASGKSVMKSIGNGVTKINVSSLQKGMHFIRTDDGHTGRFIKQ
jgi:hypothetical protein